MADYRRMSPPLVHHEIRPSTPLKGDTLVLASFSDNHHHHHGYSTPVSSSSSSLVQQTPPISSSSSSDDLSSFTKIETHRLKNLETVLMIREDEFGIMALSLLRQQKAERVLRENQKLYFMQTVNRLTSQRILLEKEIRRCKLKIDKLNVNNQMLREQLNKRDQSIKNLEEVVGNLFTNLTESQQQNSISNQKLIDLQIKYNNHDIIIQENRITLQQNEHVIQNLNLEIKLKELIRVQQMEHVKRLELTCCQQEEKCTGLQEQNNALKSENQQILLENQHLLQYIEQQKDQITLLETRIQNLESSSATTTPLTPTTTLLSSESSGNLETMKSTLSTLEHNHQKFLEHLLFTLQPDDENKLSNQTFLTIEKEEDTQSYSSRSSSLSFLQDMPTRKETLSNELENFQIDESRNSEEENRVPQQQSGNEMANFAYATSGNNIVTNSDRHVEDSQRPPENLSSDSIDNGEMKQISSFEVQRKELDSNDAEINRDDDDDHLALRNWIEILEDDQRLFQYSILELQDKNEVLENRLTCVCDQITMKLKDNSQNFDLLFN